MTIATYDIGTTAVKGVLINEKGEVLSSVSKTISTIFDNEKKEQRPQDWFDAFCGISKGFAAMDACGGSHHERSDAGCDSCGP